MLTLHFIDKSNTLEPTNMNAMNKWTKTLLLATAMGGTLAFSSCLDDDDNYYTAYNGAIVTAQPYFRSTSLHLHSATRK